MMIDYCESFMLNKFKEFMRVGRNVKCVNLHFEVDVITLG